MGLGIVGCCGIGTIMGCQFESLKLANKLSEDLQLFIGNTERFSLLTNYDAGLVVQAGKLPKPRGSGSMVMSLRNLARKQRIRRESSLRFLVLRGNSRGGWGSLG